MRTKDTSPKNQEPETHKQKAKKYGYCKGCKCYTIDCGDYANCNFRQLVKKITL